MASSGNGEETGSSQGRPLPSGSGLSTQLLGRFELLVFWPPSTNVVIHSGSTAGCRRVRLPQHTTIASLGEDKCNISKITMSLKIRRTHLIGCLLL
ncbi:hypothetical protein XA68_12919 [Ophiocordyceps unilateralis]|uniref:Uncharacterized protein n=1 Tax=Ophiocordyceps unilateralis TaxID=268505 RepID=A0A2A9PCS7_OPHUN|nr:hypothetical protein XA68_12919 [Ophiocordyceps unilateralis]